MRVLIATLISLLLVNPLALSADSSTYCYQLLDLNSRIEEKLSDEAYGWLQITLETQQRIKAKFKPGTTAQIMSRSFECAMNDAHHDTEILVLNEKRSYISFESTQNLVASLVYNKYIEMISIETPQEPDPSMGVGTK